MKRLTHFFVKPLSLAFDEGSSELGPEQSFLLQSYVRKHYTGKRQSILVAGRATQDEEDGLEAERAYAVAKLLVEMGSPEKPLKSTITGKMSSAPSSSAWRPFPAE